MLSSANFKGQTEFTRQGVLSKVVLPEALKGSMTYDADVNADGRTIEMGEGNSVYVVTNELGLKVGEQAGINFFFVDGGVMFELTSGFTVIKGENGNEYIVDVDGEVDYPEDSDRIEYVSNESLREHAKLVIRSRYGVSDEYIDAYIDNFLFEATVSSDLPITQSGKSARTVMSSNVTSIKFGDLYEDLGAGMFVFTNLKETEEVDEEEEEEETDWSQSGNEFDFTNDDAGEEDDAEEETDNSEELVTV